MCASQRVGGGPLKKAQLPWTLDSLSYTKIICTNSGWRSPWRGKVGRMGSELDREMPDLGQHCPCCVAWAHYLDLCVPLPSIVC